MTPEELWKARATVLLEVAKAACAVVDSANEPYRIAGPHGSLLVDKKAIDRLEDAIVRLREASEREKQRDTEAERKFSSPDPFEWTS